MAIRSFVRLRKNNSIYYIKNNYVKEKIRLAMFKFYFLKHFPRGSFPQASSIFSYNARVMTIHLPYY